MEQKKTKRKNKRLTPEQREKQRESMKRFKEKNPTYFDDWRAANLTTPKGRRKRRAVSNLRTSELTPEELEARRVKRAAYARELRAKKREHFREYQSAYQREYRKDSIRKKMINKSKRDWYAERKLDPVKYEAFLKEARERAREYKSKKRAENKQV